MKEFQDIQKINIRLAQKFEKMGYFKEADEIDNMNFMLSQRITIAGGPGTKSQFDYLEIGDSIPKGDQKINVNQVLQGIQIGLEKLTGKSVNLLQKIPAASYSNFSNAVGKFLGAGTALYETALFFKDLANDPSGTYGDSALDKAKIAKSLSTIATGLGMLATSMTGSPVALFITSVAAIIQVSLTLYIGIFNPTDDYDEGKTPFPGTAEEFVNKAIYLSDQKDTHDYAYYKRTKNILPAKILAIKQKIRDIAVKNNYTGTSVIQAHSLLDSITSSGTKSREEVDKDFNLLNKPKKKPTNDPANRPREYDFGQYSP
jgi:hypothetical protein